MPLHSHIYSGSSSYDEEHLHRYGGVTAKAPNAVTHEHTIEGITTFNHEHEHHYVSKTGPSINLLDGRHYHYFESAVESTAGHIHYISGYTSAD